MDDVDNKSNKTIFTKKKNRQTLVWILAFAVLFVFILFSFKKNPGNRIPVCKREKMKFKISSSCSVSS